MSMEERRLTGGRERKNTGIPFENFSPTLLHFKYKEETQIQVTSTITNTNTSKKLQLQTQVQIQTYRQ